MIPGGGIVIDTPGMRELQLWNTDDGLNSVYQEIESLALQCKFSDCTHTKEKGCAIIDAIKNGWLDEEKMKGYQNFKRN
jgi:ribosome biogenesis GTPase / thiamine phosphate phosphatase